LAQDARKPNIVVIWGDDIGMWNVGIYTHGMVGSTPNIDRIAKMALYLPIITANPLLNEQNKTST
jgi:arylsulfatase A-like enzyme